MESRPHFLIVIFSCVLFSMTVRGQARDPWSRIAAYDSDQDGQVTQREFKGPAQVMRRFDQNGDGILTKEEVAQSRTMQRSGGKGIDPAPQVGSRAPKVKALSLETGEMVDLANPNRTSVLVFGSHT